MKFLIDTHVFLWAILEPHRLSVGMKRLLLEPGHDVAISAASVWEIGAKYALNRLPLALPPDVLVPQQLEAQSIQVLPLTLAHALHAHRLPLHHRDPFDRMIIAQAIEENMPIMTADPAFGRYRVRVLR